MRFNEKVETRTIDRYSHYKTEKEKIESVMNEKVNRELRKKEIEEGESYSEDPSIIGNCISFSGKAKDRRIAEKDLIEANNKLECEGPKGRD